ncbi:hypothetical protein J4Q44_G00369900 [Coregonus suidteri]|uniref:Neuronal cell adhesion molecule-like n=1 Tax=Coregonus suidteri TaxID=861788 RepID=A0AAN8KTR9_9TELE
MDRKRKWVLSSGALLVIFLGHMTTALEVPLDPKVLEGLPQPPTITHQSPKDFIIDPRENILIYCEAKGKPHPSFSWTRNGTHFDVEKDSKVLMKPSSGTLVIDISGEKAEAYEGVYQCTARNERGTAVSNNIIIRQSRSPLWSKERNEAIMVQVGVSLVLRCRPPAGLPPPIIFWMDNNFQRLPQNTRVSQALNGDLYFSNVLLDDTRNDYICYARFPHTQTIQQKQPITVKVLDNSPSGERQPSFMAPLGKSSTQMALRGGVLELECIAEGLPTPEPTRILAQPEYMVVQRNRKAVFECKVKHDPTLIPTMTWLKDNGELPDDERFVVDTDSLTIKDVTEGDEGTYTCVMNTTLDQDSASAMLTVVEATPTPAITSVVILMIDYKFLVQYEDLLHQAGVWHNLTEVEGTKTTAHLDLSPYVYYSFRVLAMNHVGHSQPSQPSRQYRTNPAAPAENPTDVQGVGTEHNNLVISWKELTGLQSNGPGLQYKVNWRQKDVEEDWSSETVANASKYVVSGTPTFVPYEVKVQAVNDYGNGPAPETVVGYSGEDVPMSAPESVQVLVQNGTLAEVHWEPVLTPMVRGRLQGYKVTYWRERSLHQAEGQQGEQQVLAFSGNRSEGRLPGLQPYSLYTLNIRVVNGKGEGPPSPNQNFETPEGIPGPPSFLRIKNPNMDSLTLEWGPPQDNNGRLTGYTLKYQTVNNSNELGPMEEMTFPANETTITLANLKYSTRYKFYFNAKTIKGSGPTITEEAVTIMDEAFIQQPIVDVVKGHTEPHHPISPITQSLRPPFHKVGPIGPAFTNVNSSVVGEEGAVISWEYFGPDKNVYVEYIVENSKEDWTKEFVNGSSGSQTYLIKGLKPGTSYRVRVVVKDHSEATIHSTEELVITLPAMKSNQVDLATQGWFIGLMCAIALLILVLLIVCFIKRNKGGKYPVKEKEDAHQDPEIQPMKEDDGTFGEYSDTEDHKPLKGSRTPSNGTVKRDDSDDSLVDYGEGGDGQFNEDGSFIGQYSGKKEKDTHEGNESSEAPSPVNAMNSFV